MYKTIISILVSLLLFPIFSSAKVLPGLVDRAGNPVHSADEFNLLVATTVTPDPQGYRYTYDLASDLNSIQPVWHFMIFLPDVTGFVSNSSFSPWGIGWGPKQGGSKQNISIRWGVLPDVNEPLLLRPNMALTGFSFVSPYPPGIAEAYAEGVTEGPWYDDVPGGYDAFDTVTPYGPGKVFPVIGPVKPATPNVTDNYSVIGCANGLCDVQLDITGPMDVDGTKYAYQWSGPFGTALGAKPVVRLAAGTHQVTVSVSDAQGVVLATATMPVTVVDPNSPGGSGSGDNGRPDDDHEDDGEHHDEGKKGQDRD